MNAWNFSNNRNSYFRDLGFVWKVFRSTRNFHRCVGPTLADAAPSEQWRYDVIVLSQPCYDLFVEDDLEKWRT